MFQGLPKKIKVGPYDIKIELVNQVNDGDSWAEYDLIKRKISIDRAQPCRGSSAAVALHEVLHAIWHLGGMNASLKGQTDGGDVEEKIVDVFATWLTGIFKDNPAFFKWYGSLLSLKETRRRGKSR